MYYNIIEIAILQQYMLLIIKEKKRMINKRYILIDSENLSPGEYTGIDKLSNHDTIVVFNSIFSEGCINWKLLYKIQQKAKNEQPKIIHINIERKANANEKDKMDYYMIAHITQLLSKDNTLSNKFKNLFKRSETEYCIISKDKGFDRYIDYFKDIYSATVRRFNNFNDLQNYYKKDTTKETVSSNKKGTSSVSKNTDNSIAITNLSNEIKNLTKLVKDLSDRIEDKNLNNSHSDTAIKDNLTSLSNCINDVTIDTLISKEKINCNNNDTNSTFDGESNYVDVLDGILDLDTDNSNVIYLSNFKDYDDEEKENNNSEIKCINSNTSQVEDTIKTFKSTKQFKKLNIKKFNENYNSYPKKKKLLRDGLFIKTIFTKHNLYSKYDNKSLDKFIRDCDEGLINIKTMTTRLTSSFPSGSIKDFRPALNEIIKYQIKNDIM